MEAARAKHTMLVSHQARNLALTSFYLNLGASYDPLVFSAKKDSKKALPSWACLED